MKIISSRKKKRNQEGNRRNERRWELAEIRKKSSDWRSGKKRSKKSLHHCHHHRQIRFTHDDWMVITNDKNDRFYLYFPTLANPRHERDIKLPFTVFQRPFNVLLWPSVDASVTWRILNQPPTYWLPPSPFSSTWSIPPFPSTFGSPLASCEFMTFSTASLILSKVGWKREAIVSVERRRKPGKEFILELPYSA